MDNLKALGCFMNYCNWNNEHDDDVSQDRFQHGMEVILKSSSWRFDWCENTQDVLTEIHWPNVR